MKKSKEYNEKYFSYSERDRDADKVSGELLMIAKVCGESCLALIIGKIASRATGKEW